MFTTCYIIHDFQNWFETLRTTAYFSNMSVHLKWAFLDILDVWIPRKIHYRMMVFNVASPAASKVTDIQHWFWYCPSLVYLDDILIFFTDWGRTSLLVTHWVLKDAFFLSQSWHYHLFPLNLWNAPGGFGEHHWPDIGRRQGIGETEGHYWLILVVASGSLKYLQKEVITPDSAEQMSILSMGPA